MGREVAGKRKGGGKGGSLVERLKRKRGERDGVVVAVHYASQFA